MNENITEIETTVNPAEGLLLATESADLTLRRIDKALELVGEHVLEQEGAEDETSPRNVELYSILCLVQESARHCMDKLAAARQNYLDMPR